MKKLLLFSILVFCLASCLSPVPENAGTGTAPNPTTIPENYGRVDIPDARINYYDIHGSTEAELRTDLNSRGPNGSDAYTKWNVRWNWPGYGEANCSLQDATINLDVQVIFPYWYPPSDASPNLINKWSIYIKNLAVHEQGHVNNITQHYKEVLSAIKAASCTTAENAAQAALGPMHQFDLFYDATTNHGATQGATFP